MVNKSTKRALFMSVMSLVLCFAMLLGTTYAWFTDSVTSAGNVIVSGTLDVEMFYADGKEEPANATWNNAADVAIYKANQLWEPGYTDAKHIKIANKGTLALKYQLFIAPEGEVSELAEVIDVYYIDPAKAVTRDALAALTPVGTLKDLINNGIKNGSLAADAECAITLVFKMRESAGNEYQGKSIGDNFAIKLIATQDTVENDSFDNYYDGGAALWNGDADFTWYNPDATEITIGTPEQLAGLAAIVNGEAVILTAASENGTTTAPIVDDFAGQTITLASDIDLGNLAWTPIGNWDNAFSGTFDGNGYTIKNLYIDDAKGEGIGFFGVTVKATIKGITLENVDINAYSMVAGIVGAAYPANISDCHIIGDVEIVAEYAYVAGIAGYCYYGTQVSDCSVIADEMGNITAETRNAVGGITAWLLEGDHKVLNCHVENLNLTGWTNVGSITGFVHYNNTIEGCTAENVVLTKTRGDGNPGIGLIAGGYSYNANNATTLKNNTVNGATLNGTHVSYATYNTLYGSEYGGATDANFVLENNVVENVTNNLVEVKTIKTVAELKAALTTGGKYALANAVDGKEDWTLALSETVTVPAGVEVTLDMNGKTIAATSTETGKNFAAINVGKGGVLTVNGGTLTTEHKGENMGWNNSTQVFDVVSGGVLNLNNVYVKNLGGSDMAYAVNIGNNGGATLNASACTLESVNYTALRIFNNADGDVNVNLANGTVLTSSSAPFFVHFWTEADLGAKMEARQAYLHLNFNDTKVSRYSGSKSLIRFGFTDAIYYSSTAMNEVVAGNEKALKWALENGKNVLLNNDIEMKATLSNGYGATGIVIDGQTLDGNGYTLTVTEAVTTWDSAIFIKSGTVKNITVAKAFRGIFTSDAATGDIYLDNVSFDGVTYTFNSDGTSDTREGGVYISNSAMNGWTSFSNTHTEVVFTNCTFAKGNGYKFCRPYNITKFVGCTFAESYTMDARTAISFEDCKIAGVALTADNIATLVTSNTSNATVVK